MIIRELNNKLRNAMLILGGAVVIYKIIDGAKKEAETEAEAVKSDTLGFDSREFDDIW